MKKTSPDKAKVEQPDDLDPEYRFNYGKAGSNRFADRTRPESVAILLDPDVAHVFDTGKTVNDVLRALINAMPGGGGESHR